MTLTASPVVSQDSQGLSFPKGSGYPGSQGSREILPRGQNLGDDKAFTVNLAGDCYLGEEVKPLSTLFYSILSSQQRTAWPKSKGVRRQGRLASTARVKKLNEHLEKKNQVHDRK